jgi:pimeloyl-ACP methyl ester carboxylesterase
MWRPLIFARFAPTIPAYSIKNLLTKKGRHGMKSKHVPLAVAGALLLVSPLGAGEKPAHEYMTASDGVKIHYMTEGRGTPVILIHGFTGSAEGNWFANGIADALAANHRVIALDVRGHGKSDKPHEAAKYGDHLWKDVFELMDHLKIERAHVHGYSMGGMIVTQLLAHHPERFITASYGGSGVPETDAKQKSEVPKDKPGPDPQEAEARQKLQNAPHRDPQAFTALTQSFRSSLAQPVDLSKVTIPVLAINGEFDGPNAKTHRLQRELKDFRSVILPGKSHLTAIMAGYIPDLYIKTLVEFIDSHDK